MTTLTTRVLPHPVYTPEQVREHEAAAAKQAECSLYNLMERAGESVYQLISTWFDKPGVMTVICGVGNNGGDGYVVATLARRAGWRVNVVAMSNSKILTGDALTAQQTYLAEQGNVSNIEQLDLSDSDVIVDAILGTGGNKPLADAWANVVEQINQSSAVTVSIDVPSGLHSGTGAVLSNAVKADHTVTFIGLKSGLLTAKAKSYVGNLHFAGLGVDAIFQQQNRAYYYRTDWNQLRSRLVAREATAYKNQFGHVVCIGGDKGMAGAIKMAAESCLRTGAGLVTVLTHPDNVQQVADGRPELMVYGVNGLDNDVLKIIDKASVLLVGPGMGRSGWANGFMNQIVQLDKPMVVDADGLNWLAESPAKNAHWILTPHSGEAARLLKQNTESIELDRYSASFELCARYGGVAILKGAGTLITSNRKTHINLDGNPGMATAGMGDVLAGICAGLLAQAPSLGLDSFKAAELAVAIHAQAGDKAAINGERGMIASDVIDQIRAVVNLA